MFSHTKPNNLLNNLSNNITKLFKNSKTYLSNTITLSLLGISLVSSSLNNNFNVNAEPTNNKSEVSSVAKPVEATTPTPAQPTCTTNQFKAEYFNMDNVDTNGRSKWQTEDLYYNPVLATDCVDKIDFRAWNTKPLNPATNGDFFSSRYTGDFDLTPGKYEFNIVGDDIAKLYINNNLVGKTTWEDMTNWNPVTGGKTFEVTIPATSSTTNIKVEHKDGVGAAVVKLNWEKVGDLPKQETTPATPVVTQPTCTTNQFKAEYFNMDNVDTNGRSKWQTEDLYYNNVSATECLDNLNLVAWDNNPFNSATNGNFFSSRYTGDFSLTPGIYEFNLVGDDFIKLYINNNLVEQTTWEDITNWSKQEGGKTVTVTIPATSSTTNIKVEHKDGVGASIVKLSWARVGELAINNPDLYEKVKKDGKVNIIVQLKTDYADPDLKNKQDEVLKTLVNPENVVKFELTQGFGITVNKDDFLRLDQNTDKVTTISENSVDESSLSESIKNVQADKVHSPLTATNPATGQGTTIAIIDTGVDYNHPFLQGKMVQEFCFSGNGGTLVGQSTCPGGVGFSAAPGSGLNCSLAIDPGCDHGTHVAGIALGKNGPNGINGVAPDAKLVAVQAFSYLSLNNNVNTVSYVADQISSLDRLFALKSGNVVPDLVAVNMSLGGGNNVGPCLADPRRAAIIALKNVEVATIAATGNNGFNNSISAPACIPEVVSVASTSKNNDGVSGFSNISVNVDLYAPGSGLGGGIESSVPGGLYAFQQGTSMAAPHVAGSFALLKSLSPTSTIDQIEDALKTTGRTINVFRNQLASKPRINTCFAGNLLLGNPEAIWCNVISGILWEDLNNNGIQDPGEPPLNNITLNLLSQTLVVLRTATSGMPITLNGPVVAGGYRFVNLPEGNTYIIEVVTNAYTLSKFSPFGTPTTIDQNFFKNNNRFISNPTSLFPGSTTTQNNIDGGLININAPRKISGRVWNDLSRGHLISSYSNRCGPTPVTQSEPFLSGVRVNLLRLDRTPVLDVNGNPEFRITDVGGNYSFDNLIPGFYKIQVEIDNKYVVTERINLFDVGNHINFRAPEIGYSLDLFSPGGYGNGEIQLIVNAGLWEKTPIGRVVYLDANQNGIQDNGEVGINGVEVRLRRRNIATGNITVITKFTANINGIDGSYIFDDGEIGDPTSLEYLVEFVSPAGFRIGTLEQPNWLRLDGCDLRNKASLFDLAQSFNAGIVPIISTNLATTKTSDKNEYTPGETVTYTISVQNQGPANATNVKLDDVLDPNLTFVSSNCTKTNNTYDFGDINVGQTKDCEIKATVNPNVVDQTIIPNVTSNLTLNQLDTDNSDNIGNKDITVLVPQSVDIEMLDITFSKNPANPGDTIEVTLKFRNNGPNTATNVRITSQLGAGLIDSGQQINLISSNVNATLNPVSGIFEFPQLDSQQEGQIVYSFVVGNQNGVTLPDNNDVTEQLAGVDQTDTNPNNDYIVVEITIENPPIPQTDTNLSVTKTSDKNEYTPGETVTYTISIENQGPSNATNVKLDDVLDSNLEFVSTNCPKTGDTIDFGDIANGATKDCQFVVKLKDQGSCPNGGVVQGTNCVATINNPITLRTDQACSNQHQTIVNSFQPFGPTGQTYNYKVCFESGKLTPANYPQFYNPGNTLKTSAQIDDGSMVCPAPFFARQLKCGLISNDNKTQAQKDDFQVDIYSLMEATDNTSYPVQGVVLIDGQIIPNVTSNLVLDQTDTDNSDNIGNKDITVRILNQAPVAVDGNEEVEQDQTIEIDLSTLVTDSDGTIDYSTIEIVTQPTQGTIVSIVGNKITYKANPSQTEKTDFITIKVKDDKGATSNEFKVNIKIKYSLVSCPTGTTNDGQNNCIAPKICPTGSNGPVDNNANCTQPTQVQTGWNCPAGWTNQNNGNCTIVQQQQTGTNYSCPNGGELQGTNCVATPNSYINATNCIIPGSQASTNGQACVISTVNVPGSIPLISNNCNGQGTMHLYQFNQFGGVILCAQVVGTGIFPGSQATVIYLNRYYNNYSYPATATPVYGNVTTNQGATPVYQTVNNPVPAICDPATPALNPNYTDVKYCKV